MTRKYGNIVRVGRRGDDREGIQDLSRPPKSVAVWAPLPASKAVHLVRLPKQHTFSGMKKLSDLKRLVVHDGLRRRRYAA
jgi:hypothetical protein